MSKTAKPLEVFERFVRPLWQAGNLHIGLAVSGGVDSMAQAALAAQALENERVTSDGVGRQPHFTSFIVDHKIRSGSGDEARKVADELQRLGMEPRILPLDWSGHGDPSKLTNLEEVARRLRYRALGKAALDHGIAVLLMGHHADDQAETVLTRILARHTGPGLAGMQQHAPIPECDGVYGVNASGSPHMWKGYPHEAGGVSIARPLLTLLKAQLIDVCQSSRVRWFEDYTNRDPTLTMRNAIRHVQNLLPMALRRDRMLKLAQATSERCDSQQREADATTSRMLTNFEFATGSASFDVSRGLHPAPKDIGVEGGADTAKATDHAVVARVVRNMVEIVSAKAIIPLTALDLAVDMLLRAQSKSDRKAGGHFQVAGVSCKRLPGSSDIVCQRQPPYAREAEGELVLLSPAAVVNKVGAHRAWSRWRLWDGRYWIAVAPPIGTAALDREVFVRFLRKGDMAQFRSGLRPGARKSLQARLSRYAPNDLRWQLPALVERVRGEHGLSERVVALPSLPCFSRGWRSYDPSQRDGWQCRIRYRHSALASGHYAAE